MSDKRKTELNDIDSMKSSVKYIQDFKFQIVWERWDPNKRTDIDNQNYSFIKFKGNDMSKTFVMKVMDLRYMGKSTDDIAWIAKIPEFFKNFDLIN